MNRYILILSFGIAMWLAPFDCYQSKGAPAPGKAGEKQADNDQLCVTVWPKTTRVQIGQEFDVTLRIVNATEKLQSFNIYGPDWSGQWTTDNARISHNDINVFSGRVSEIKLEPGEAYEYNVQLIVKEGSPLKLISFRMGFAPDTFFTTMPPLPKAGQPHEDRGKKAPGKTAAVPPKDDKKIYWSNRVVLGIKPGKRK